ncbi:MAG: hypothetical protein AAF236_11110 [Verrucomicrobiota bacterium]
MPLSAPARSADEICAELEAGTYCGHLGRDDQWQVDVLSLLKAVADGTSNPEPPPQIEENIILACAPGDPETRFWVRITLDEETGAVTYIRIDTGAAIAPSEFAPCPEILKHIKSCWKLAGDPDRYFYEHLCILSDGSQLSVVWEQGVGEVAALPAGVEPCDAVQFVCCAASHDFAGPATITRANLLAYSPLGTAIHGVDIDAASENDTALSLENPAPSGNQALIQPGGSKCFGYGTEGTNHMPVEMNDWALTVPDGETAQLTWSYLKPA